MIDILIVVGTLVALVVLAELAVRFAFRRQRRYIWPPGTRIHMQLDPESLPEMEKLARFEVNRDGERGPEPAPAGTSQYRILVIGGSAAECFYLDGDSSWPGVVARELNAPESRAVLGVDHVHVGNIARAGTGSKALEKMLEGVLPHYDDLDLVLCMVGASDVLKWLARGAPDDGEIPPIRPRDLFALRPDKTYGWHPRRTALFDLLRRLRQRLTGRIDVRERTGKMLKVVREMRQDATTMREETGDSAAIRARFDRCFRGLLGLCQKHAKRTIVVRQPWFEKEHTPEEQRQFWNAAQGDPFNEPVDTYFTMRVLADRLREIDGDAAAIADEMGIEHIDLMPVLEHSRRTFYDFFHFTPFGAETVGRAVASVIVENSERRSSAT